MCAPVLSLGFGSLWDTAAWRMAGVQVPAALTTGCTTGAVAVPIETLPKRAVPVEPRAGEGKRRGRKGKGRAAGREDETEDALMGGGWGASDDEADWVPTVKVFNACTGRYEAADDGTPLPAPAAAVTVVVTPKPSAFSRLSGAPAASDARERDTHSTQGGQQAMAPPPGLSTTAAEKPQQPWEVELAAARAKAAHAEDLAEQLRVQVRAGDRPLGAYRWC
jgi:hypothetical protein